MASEKKAKEIMEKAQELMQMYKAGFLDGYSKAKNKKIKWPEIYPLCLEGWKKRVKK